ncbi:MAG TPA: zf-HC2 domain-containing protein [Actinomycetota bacterium]|nr:zf-HC2 domain-containing protein [Actinomycetota bacterium]
MSPGSDPPLNHPEKALSSYLDGALPARRAAAIERHLAACEPCRAELEALRSAKSAVGGLGAPPEPGWLPEIARRLSTSPPPRLSYRTQHALRRRAGVAAATAAVLGIGILLVPPAPAPVSFQQEVRQHLVLINEPAADQSSFVVIAP